MAPRQNLSGQVLVTGVTIATQIAAAGASSFAVRTVAYLLGVMAARPGAGGVTALRVAGCAGGAAVYQRGRMRLCPDTRAGRSGRGA